MPILGIIASAISGNLIQPALIISHDTSPFVTAYPWSSGFGTKYADPATLPAGNANDVAAI